MTSYNITIPHKAKAWGALDRDEFGVNMSYSEALAFGIYSGWSREDAQVFADAYSKHYPVDASRRSDKDREQVRLLILRREACVYLKSGACGIGERAVLVDQKKEVTP
tara:strand:- start:83 stop:406 length:324 start_codon:yes stop_codon:yes gene_type:complete